MILPDNFIINQPKNESFSAGYTYVKTETSDPMIPYNPERSCGYVISDGDKKKLNPKRRFIFIVRHGETDWNAAGRFQGREDNPINEKGREQAHHCGNMIKKSLTANRLKVEKIFSSPLKRAETTAYIISEKCGITSPETVFNLIERDYGPLSGLTPSERKEKFNGIKTDDVIGVESVEIPGLRMLESIKNMCCDNPDENILAVSHGGILNSLITLCTGGIIGSGITLTTNCCVNVFSEDSGSGIFTLEAFNLTPKGFGEYKLCSEI